MAKWRVWQVGDQIESRAQRELEVGGEHRTIIMYDYLPYYEHILL